MDLNSLSHSKWNCKYHIVFAPKYRRKVIYGQLKKDIADILSKLCKTKGVHIVEAEMCPDHVHMLVEIPPSMSVAYFMGYLKGKKYANDFRKACESEVQVWQQAFLVQRLLCRYSRKECEENTGVHPKLT